MKLRTDAPLGADAIAGFVLVVAVLVGGWARMTPGVAGAFHDDGVYALTAKALANGDGYRLIQLPGSPPQTKYPILYPAFLSLFWDEDQALPSRIAAMQVATLLTAALAVAGFFLYAVRYGYAGRVAAFAGCAIAASAPNFLYYSTSLLSELPFALAVVGALWAAEAEIRAVRPSVAREALAGVVIGLPFLVRTAGIAIAPAALLAIALHRKRTVWSIVGAALAMLPWLAWSLLAASPVTEPVVGYQTDYTDWLLDVWRTLGPGFVLVNVGKALAAVTHISFEAATRELYARTDAARLLVRLIGGIPWLWLALRLRHRDVAAFVAVGYFTFVCCWPWAPDRFLIPLLPLVAIALFAVLEQAATRIVPVPLARIAVAGLAAILVMLNVALLARYSNVSRASGYPYFMLPDEAVAWTSYEKSFAWLRAQSDASDVVVAGFDTMTALYTERRAIRPFVPRPDALFYGVDAPLVGTVDELAALLDTYRPRYFFMSPMPAFPEEAPLYELVARYTALHPSHLVPAYVGEDARFVVYDVDVRR